MWLRLQGSSVAESTALSYRGGGTTTRASGECATAVIRIRERTAAELTEFVVCLSSTEGYDSHRGRHQQSLFCLRSCKQEKGWTLAERPHWEEAQEGLHRQSGRVKDETLTLKG